MLRLDLPILDETPAARPSGVLGGSAARAHALAALALPVHPEIPVAESIAIGRRGLELATSTGEPLVVAFAASNLGIAALAGGRPWGWDLIDRALAAALEAADRRERTRIHANAAQAALWLGDYDRVALHSAACRELAALESCEWLNCFAGVIDSETTFRREGRLDDESILDRCQEPPGALLAGRVALHRGDLEWAELTLLPLADRGFSDGYPDIAGTAAANLAAIALARGDHQGAVAWAGRAVIPARAGASAWWADTLPQAVAALAAADVIHEAESLLAEAAESLVDAVAPRAEAALDHARGVVAGHGGRNALASTFLCRAGERYAQLPEIEPSRVITEALSRL